MEEKNYNVAYMGPWGEHGEKLKIIVNGHNGLPALFDGGDFYPWADIKNKEDLTFLEKYDFVIVPFYGEFLDWIMRLATTTKTKIFAITDIELNALPYAEHDVLTKIVKTAKAVTWLASSNPDFTDLLRTFRPDVIEVGGWCLYPDIHEKYIINPKHKMKDIITIGCSNTGYNRDILNNLCVFKRLKEYFPELKGVLYNVHPDWIKRINALISEIGVPDVFLVGEFDWEKFISELSNCYMAIHMYSFRVVSRMAQDCAALGIPMVGGDVNYANRFLFPDLSVDPFNVQGAVEKCIKLMVNQRFYDSCRAMGLERSLYYSRNSVRDRITAGIRLGEIKQ